MNYDKYLNNRAKVIQPSGIRKFFDIVSEIKGAISLGVGEPDFATPWEIKNSAIKSIQKGYTQYSSNAGMKELREMIKKYLKSRFCLDYSVDNILVTVGASEAIDLALRVLLEPGDEVLVPEPSYVSYQPCIMMSEGVAVPIKCEAKDNFKLTKESLLNAITPKSKVLIMPYPNNPTGAIMEKAHLEEIAQVIEDNDLIVISDEIYAELTYGKLHYSIARVSGMKERTIVINGFSKAFAMTGWRLGFLACPIELLTPMYRVHQYTIMCAPSPSQYGAIAGLAHGFEDNFATIGAMRDEYNKRRRFMVHSFNEMGLDCFTPEGAFYVFPCVRSLNMNGEQFANELLKQEKVAVVPGSAFGASGEDFIRCSYAYSMRDLDRAVDRIANFVNSVKKKG